VSKHITFVGECKRANTQQLVNFCYDDIEKCVDSEREYWVLLSPSERNVYFVVKDLNLKRGKKILDKN
jgi:hypothetical protein